MKWLHASRERKRTIIHRKQALAVLSSLDTDTFYWLLQLCSRTWVSKALTFAAVTQNEKGTQ